MKFLTLVCIVSLAGCATTGASMPSPQTITAYAVAGVKVANAAVEITKAVRVIGDLTGDPKGAKN